MDDRYLSSNSQQKRFKIIIVGDSNVGKTALFWRFTEGEFLAQKETQVTTIDFKIKNITLKSKPIKLYIWDTAGQQKYRSIVSTYFKGCHGIMMVFDLSRQSSFSNIKEQWYDLCKLKAEKSLMILVGNKSDLEKRVSEEEVRQWCAKVNITYISTSVKLNLNVEEAFMSLAKIVQEKEEVNEQLGNRTESFALKNKKKKKDQKGGCC